MSTRLKKLRRVFVWELPVRVYHWINAGSIVVLCITGYLMGTRQMSIPVRKHPTAICLAPSVSSILSPLTSSSLILSSAYTGDLSGINMRAGIILFRQLKNISGTCGKC